MILCSRPRLKKRPSNIGFGQASVMPDSEACVDKKGASKSASRSEISVLDVSCFSMIHCPYVFAAWRGRASSEFYSEKGFWLSPG